MVYSIALRLQAIKLILQGYFKSEVAKKLNIPFNTISVWCRKYGITDDFYRQEKNRKKLASDLEEYLINKKFDLIK